MEDRGRDGEEDVKIAAGDGDVLQPRPFAGETLHFGFRVRDGDGRREEGSRRKPSLLAFPPGCLVRPARLSSCAASAPLPCAECGPGPAAAGRRCQPPGSSWP